jgi:hypothetical protein
MLPAQIDKASTPIAATQPQPSATIVDLIELPMKEIEFIFGGAE